MLDVVSFEHHPLNPGNAVPFFISAGPLKEAAQLMRFTEIRDPLLMPTIVAGGFTLNEWSGNGEPDFVYYPELGMAGNSRGLPNEGKDGILSLKEPIRILRSLGAKVVIQVTNLPHESPLDVIPMLPR